MKFMSFLAVNNSRWTLISPFINQVEGLQKVFITKSSTLILRCRMAANLSNRAVQSATIVE